MLAIAGTQQLAVLKRYVNCSNNNRGSQTPNDVKNPTKCYLFGLNKKKLPPALTHVEELQAA